MRSDTNQLDLYTHSDQGIAEAYRVAADTARRNPFETPDRCEQRARLYEQQASEHEARARRKG